MSPSTTNELASQTQAQSTASVSDLAAQAAGPLDVAASKDVNHPAFHLNFGKIMATVFLGLHAYGMVRQAQGNKVDALTDPGNLTQFASGFASIWLGGGSQQQ